MNIGTERGVGHASQYVELHARSAFSFLRGASIPESYAAHWAELVAKQTAAPAIALTDVDGVYGSVRLHGEGVLDTIQCRVNASFQIVRNCVWLER